MRRVFSAVTIVASLCLAASHATAQEAKTIAVVSLGSYDNLVNHAQTMGTLVGFPTVKQMVEGQIAAMTGGKGLAGMDKTKPLVVVVQMADDQPYPVICIPVTDLQQALGVLPGPMGQTEDAGDGVKLLPNAPQPMHLKEQTGYAYLAENKEELAAVPANPQELVGELATKYVVAARVMMQNIPADMRAETLSFLQTMSTQGLGGSGLDDEELRLQRNVLDRQMERIKRLSAETDEIVFGLGIDENDQRIFIDFSMTALAGSPTAKEYARIQKTTSKHAGLAAADAAVTMLGSMKGPRSDDELAVLNAQHQQAKTRALAHIDGDAGIPAAVKATVKEAITDLVDVAFETLKSDTFDGGMAMFANDKSTMVLGGYVADGDKVEAGIKKLIEIVKEEENLPEITWDAENHGGYRIHTTAMPTPDPQAAQFIGNEVQVALAISANSCYLAAGGDAIAQLKKVIDASAAAAAQPVDPFKAIVRLAPIATMAAPLDPTGMAQQLAQQLQQGGNIVVTAEGIPNGVKGRLEIEPNVIKAVGQMAMMFMTRMQGGAEGKGVEPQPVPF